MAERFTTPFHREFDTNGLSLDGAKLFFFDSATGDQKSTFSDNALTLANTNPVIADGNGRFSDIFLATGTYKVILQDKNGVQIFEADPYTASSDTLRDDLADTTDSTKNSKLVGHKGGQTSTVTGLTVWDELEKGVNIERWTNSATSDAERKTAVQAAFDEMIGVPNAQLNINTNIQIDGTVTADGTELTLQGKNWLSGIQNNATDASDCLVFKDTVGGEARQIHINDLRILGNASSGRGVWLDNPARCTFNRVKIGDHGDIGVFVDRNTNFNFMISFYDCWFTDNGSWGMDIDNGNAVNLYNCSFQTNVGELRFDGQYINMFGGYIGGTTATSGGAVEIAGAAGSGGNSAGGLFGVGFENNGLADAHLYIGGINNVKGFNVNQCYFTNPGGKSGNISCIKVKLHKQLTISGGLLFKSGTYTGTVKGIEIEAGATTDGGLYFTPMPELEALDTNFDNTGGAAYIRQDAGTMTVVGDEKTKYEDTSGNTLGYAKNLYRDNSDNATVGTGEDDLASFTIAANFLGTDGGIRFTAHGTKTNGSAEGKTLKWYFGSAVEQVLTSVTTATDWHLEVEVVNTSATVQRTSWRCWDGTTMTEDSYDTKGVDTTNAVVVKLTGEVAGTGTDVITQTMFNVEMI